MPSLMHPFPLVSCTMWQGIEEKRFWENIKWHEVIECNPDLIVMIHASWDLEGKFTYSSALAHHHLLCPEMKFSSFFLPHIFLHFLYFLSASKKIFNLFSNKTTCKLCAIQNYDFIQVSSSAYTIGIRIGTLTTNLAESFAPLSVERISSPSSPPPSATTVRGKKALLGESTAQVYMTLPTWNNTNLNKFFPGKNQEI